MQVFERALIKSHGADLQDAIPDCLGAVDLGEPFVMETENSNMVNGPIEVRGVRAGDDIAIHIEEIEMVPPIIAPGGGPFDGLPGGELKLEDGYLVLQDRFQFRPRATLGNVGVLPSDETVKAIFRWSKSHGYTTRYWRRWMNDPRMKHCHQDCPALGPGSILHIKAQVDGAGVCMADFHAYMGAGESACNGVSCAANVRARVERSEGWLVDWPLVETENELMVCVCHDKYGMGVKEAFRACREVVAARAGCTPEEAHSVVASVMDIQNHAIFFLGEGYPPGTEEKPSSDLSLSAVIPKDIFL